MSVSSVRENRMHCLTGGRRKRTNDISLVARLRSTLPPPVHTSHSLLWDGACEQPYRVVLSYLWLLMRLSSD